MRERESQFIIDIQADWKVDIKSMRDVSLTLLMYGNISWECEKKGIYLFADQIFLDPKCNGYYESLITIDTDGCHSFLIYSLIWFNSIGVANAQTHLHILW